MTPEERAHLLAGSAYVEPSQGHTPVFTGSRLGVASQSWEDCTVPYLMQQVTLLARRLIVLEAHVALLTAALQGPTELI